MRKFMKCVVAYFLALMMTFSLVQVSAVKTKAAESIALGGINWSSDKTSYQFSNASVTLPDNTQKILCISVDNGGSFAITDEASLTSLLNTEKATISGVSYDGEDYAYTNTLSLNTKLSSMTVICRSDTSGIKGIQDFIRKLTFYRNGAAENEIQNVTAIANTLLLPDDMTAVALDNEIHYYEYVPFKDTTGKDNLTWYESYEAAKKKELNGLHGYLATITSENEQEFVYSYFVEYNKTIRNGWSNSAEAWIGGLRTFKDGFSASDWDKATVDQDKVNPGSYFGSENRYYCPESVKNKTIATEWIWMCGPETGKSFYRTSGNGAYNSGDTEVTQDGLDIPFSYWNKPSAEPNNTNPSESDPFKQEYALEYGYASEGYWNDYSPSNVSYGCMKGYIVEFSPYQNSADQGGNSEAETKPSAKSDVPVVLENSVYPSISSNDFILSRDDAKTVTKDQIKDLAQVDAKDSTGADADQSDITVSDVDFSTVTDKEDVTFTYVSGGKTKNSTSTGYVVDESNKGTGAESGKQIQIGGNHFSVSSEEAKKLTDAKIKDLAGVIALKDGTKVDTSKISIDKTSQGYKNLVNGVAGVHDITFTYDGVSVTVKATVTEYPSISANDFIVKRSDLGTIDENTVKEKSDVTGKDRNNEAVTDKNKFTVDTSDLDDLNNLPGTKKEQDITISYPDGNKKTTVTVTVSDEVGEGTGSDGTSKIQIGADNFDITPAQEEAIKASSGSYTSELTKTFVKYAEAVALKNGKKVDENEISISNITARSDGDYDVTFQYDGVKTTVRASVKVPAVSAYDFIMTKEEAANATTDTVKSEANAKGYVGTKTASTPVDFTDITCKKISGSTASGVSDGDVFEFTVTNGTTSAKTTAKANVVEKKESDSSKSDETKTVTIGANDFAISVEQAENKDALVELFKQYAGAVAFVEDANGVRVFPSQKEIASDITNIEPANGVYPVKFTYQGVSVTVNCTVKSNGTGDVAKPEDNSQAKVNITGNDFSIPAKSGILSDETFKNLANIVSKDSDGKTIDAIVNDSDLSKLNDAIQKGQKGTYDVSVGTADGSAQITIHVTVTDEGTKKSDTTDNSGTTIPGETIVANNYTIGIDDFSLIKESANEKIKENNIKLANASAYKNDTKEPIDIVSVDTSKVKNEPGTYDVTFKTANGTTTTVKLTISDDWKTIGNVDKASEANKDSETTDKSNTTAVPNDKKTDDDKKDPGQGGSTSKKEDGQKTSIGTEKKKHVADSTGTDKIFEKSNPKDITNKISTDLTVDRVIIDDTDIPSGSYTIDKDTITIKSSVFAKYDAGTKHTVSIIGKDGSKQAFTVTVINYDESTVIKKVPILKMQKNMGVGSKFTINLCGINKTAVKKYKSSNKKIATINKKGVIKAKKKGKCTITAQVIQNGSYYTVKVKVKVIKKVKLYNLKKKALSKVSGELPEFNVYKRVFLGKKTKLKFTSVEKNAKITYKSSNKKIATVTKKGVIKGKKQGFAVVTAKIEQNGKTYVTRIFVRVDDLKPNKNLKKYLK